MTDTIYYFAPDDLLTPSQISQSYNFFKGRKNVVKIDENNCDTNLVFIFFKSNDIPDFERKNLIVGIVYLNRIPIINVCESDIIPAIFVAKVLFELYHHYINEVHRDKRYKRLMALSYERSDLLREWK